MKGQGAYVGGFNGPPVAVRWVMRLLMIIAWVAGINYVVWRWRRFIDTSYWIRYGVDDASETYVSPSPLARPRGGAKRNVRFAELHFLLRMVLSETYVSLSSPVFRAGGQLPVRALGGPGHRPGLLALLHAGEGDDGDDDGDDDDDDDDDDSVVVVSGL
jgi:hypothetical protein